MYAAVAGTETASLAVVRRWDADSDGDDERWRDDRAGVAGTDGDSVAGADGAASLARWCDGGMQTATATTSAGATIVRGSLARTETASTARCL